MPETTILFIGGYARSGSTLLDRMLGQIHGFASAGEVRFLWRRGVAENRRCGCGAPFRRCPVWSAVIDDAFGSYDRVDSSDILALQRRVDQWWRIPWIASDRLGDAFARDVDRYAGLLERLFRSFQHVTGAQVIVDSSKDPSHGFLLSRLRPRYRVVGAHLVRDSRAVAYSLCERRKVDPDTGERLEGHTPIRAAAGWSGSNLFTMALRPRLHGAMTVRYEDLARRPTETVERIARLASGGPVRLPPALGEGGAMDLEPTHIVAGNPMRFERGPITVRPDEEWRARISPATRAVVTAATWPLLVTLGRSDR